MNAVTLLNVIGATHFIVGESEDDGEELPVHNWMVSAIKKFHGGLGLRVVRQELLISIDATSMLANTSASCQMTGWFISSQEDSGCKRSLYTIGASPPPNVQWFSVIQGMTAAGESLPFVLVIKHMSDAEMPAGVDIRAIPIPGWGSATGRGDESSTGWVVFIRGGSVGALKSLYDWYLQTIVVAFIRERRQRAPFNWMPGTPIPKWLLAVVWKDGEISQMHAVLRGDRVDTWEKENMKMCKTAANSSGVQSACDLSACFKLKKAALKKASLENVPNAAVWREKYATILKDTAKHGMNIKGPMLQCLTFIMTVYPSMCAAIDTPHNVSQGFVEAGFITNANNGFPNPAAILKTCKQTWSADEIEEVVKRPFAEFYKETLTYGCLTDDTMSRYGVDPDVETVRDGVPVFRKRACYINHENEIAQMTARDDARQEAALARLSKLKQDTDNHLKANDECERIVITQLQEASDAVTGGDRSPYHAHRLSKANVGMFAKCQLTQLRAFCYVRTHTSVLDKFKLPGTKGTVQMVQEGRECLLSTAFTLKDKPVLLKAPEHVVPSASQDQDSLPLVMESSPQRLHARREQSLMSKMLLMNAAWINAVDATLYGAVRNEYDDDEVTINLHKMRMNAIQEADHLAKIVWGRFPRMLELRLPDQEKRKHPVWEFVAVNIPVVCLIAVRFGHVVSLHDMRCCRWGDCLLKPQTASFLPAEGEYGELQGCYLYQHTTKNKWIRSGKVCGQSKFTQRDKEHEAMSKKSSTDPLASNFYRLFPYAECEDADHCDARPGGGLFTDLKMFVGVGFASVEAEALTKDVSEGGILKWTQSSIEVARKAGVGGQGAPLERKQLELAAYLFELVYDLMIGDDAVSTNPGFESVIRFYGRSDHDAD